MRMKKNLLFCLLPLTLFLHFGIASAELIVLQARGGGLKVGQSVSATKKIVLKEGERVTLIGPDGKSIKLRGPFDDVPVKDGGKSTDPKKALAALIATRNARTSSVGVVRSGTADVDTPDPAAIDITRGGPRCLDEGAKPEFWRPDPTNEQPFVMYPIDRSWRADLLWEKGQSRMTMPDLSKFDGVTTVLVNIDQQEFVISFSVIPKSVKDPFILTAWLLEKGCVQQANALLRTIASKQTLSTESNSVN